MTSPIKLNVYKLYRLRSQTHWWDVFGRQLINLFEISKTSSVDIIHGTCFYFNVSSVVNLIIRRKFRFLNKMLNSSNMLCAWCKDMVMLDFQLNL